MLAAKEKENDNYKRGMHNMGKQLCFKLERTYPMVEILSWYGRPKPITLWFYTKQNLDEGVIYAGLCPFTS